MKSLLIKFNLILLCIAINQRLIADISIFIQTNVIDQKCYGFIWVFASGNAGDSEVYLFNKMESSEPIESQTISDGRPYVLFEGTSGNGMLQLSNGQFYTIEVENQIGCITEENIQFNCACLGDLEINGSVGITHPGSCSTNDGSISLNLLTPVFGGEAPFSYQWDNGDTGTMIHDLCNGTLTVTVTDANGCTDEASFELETNDSPKAILLELNHATCSSFSDGSIFILNEKIESSSTLEFDWGIPCHSDEVFSFVKDLSVGAYCVTITERFSDGNVCVSQECFTIEEKQLDPIGIEYKINQACVIGINQNSIEIQSIIGGGGELFELLWSNGSMEMDLDDLIPGVYQLTITDGCLNEEVFDFTIYNVLQVEIDSDCYKEEFTLDDLIITGGTIPFIVKNLITRPGDYHTVLVEDATGCSQEIHVEKNDFIPEFESK